MMFHNSKQLLIFSLIQTGKFDFTNTNKQAFQACPNGADPPLGVWPLFTSLLRSRRRGIKDL